MGRSNTIARTLGKAARQFRCFQETYILPWWDNGGLTSIPLWALDTLVLVIKVCSTCVMAVIRVLIPPVLKSLHGETILVTGAGHGIGRELALQLAELGATIICWDINVHNNTSVVEQIRRTDGESFGYTVDVSIREDVASASRELMRNVSEVSMVVSNAGTFTTGSLYTLKPDIISRVLETNLMAHVWVIQAFLPNMIERRYGHIIAINSMSGLMSCPDSAPYCAAKCGLKGLMDSLTEELRLDSWTKNIHTTSVYLSSVSTGLYPPPCHRFTSVYDEITPKEAAKIIIEGIRKNKKEISIPCYASSLITINNALPYRIRIILIDFFNFTNRLWFRFC